MILSPTLSKIALEYHRALLKLHLEKWLYFRVVAPNAEMNRFEGFFFFLLMYFFALQTSSQWAWSLIRRRWSCLETRWSGSARPRLRPPTPCTGWRCAPSPPPSPSCPLMDEWPVSKSGKHLQTTVSRDFSFFLPFVLCCFFVFFTTFLH